MFCRERLKRCAVLSRVPLGCPPGLWPATKLLPQVTSRVLAVQPVSQAHHQSETKHPYRYLHEPEFDGGDQDAHPMLGACRRTGADPNESSVPAEAREQSQSQRHHPTCRIEMR